MNFINGKWTAGSGEAFVSLNPADRSELWSGKASTANDVAAAIDAAAAAFPAWRRLPVGEKNTIFDAFKGLLERDKEEFARLISDETGKPYWECLTEVGAMVGKLAISQKAYGERCGEKSADLPGDTRSVTRFRAIGPMAVFGPFNLPVHLPNGHIIPALIAGNTIVFKPSEQTPACGVKMVELWEEAGLPAGVLNLVHGAKETGIALTSESRLKGVLFTGSYPTGRAIHKALAGQPEKILALEMGGNNPLVVWDAEDIKAAAYSIIQSSFITSGQRCVCARRLILPEGDYGDAVLDELKKQIGCIRVGLPRDEQEPFVGPLISAASADIALAAQQKLADAGATVLVEMTRSDRCAALVTPGVVDVTAVAEREDDEVFAPLLQVIRVADYQAALDEAENTDYGLSAGLISDSEALYQELLDTSTAGIINWNRQITGAVSSAPFGGSGKSGNFRPGAYLAADYCAYPVASIETNNLVLPETLSPGIEF